MFVFGDEMPPFTLSPRLVAVRGITEIEWERKRPLWHGDCSREKVTVKRTKKNDGTAESVATEDTETVDTLRDIAAPDEVASDNGTMVNNAEA